MSYKTNDYDTANFTVSEALASLAPDQYWSVIDNDWDKVFWSEDNTQTQPTLDECKAEILKLQAAYDALEYARKREAEYPDWKTQLDKICLLYTSPSPRDLYRSRMPSSA